MPARSRSSAVALVQIGAPHLGGGLVHHGVVGGHERVFFVLEVLVEGAPGHPRAGGDRFYAHLRVAPLGGGRQDCGQDAFPLVGGDGAGQQPVPAAGQLIRPAPGGIPAPGLVAACFRWVGHRRLAVLGPPSALAGSGSRYCIRLRFSWSRRSALAQHPPRLFRPGDVAAGSTLGLVTPLPRMRGLRGGFGSLAVDSANGRVLLSGNPGTIMSLIALVGALSSHGQRKGRGARKESLMGVSR